MLCCLVTVARRVAGGAGATAADGLVPAHALPQSGMPVRRRNAIQSVSVHCNAKRPVAPHFCRTVVVITYFEVFGQIDDILQLCFRIVDGLQ